MKYDTLYLGLELPPEYQKGSVFHCPFIQVIPRPTTDPLVIHAFQHFNDYTHLIFTSRNSVCIFFHLAASFRSTTTENKITISVGQRTAEKLKDYGIASNVIANEETAEGIVKELKKIDLKQAHLFLPQSSIARTVIKDWLTQEQILYTACPIYDTLPRLPNPLPDLSQFKEIVFTSPSIVNAFIQAYGSFPNGKKFICKGPVTQSYLEKCKKFTLKNA